MKATAQRCRPLADIERWFAQQLAYRVGPDRAAELVGVSRSTYACALAGFAVHPYTAELFRRARLDVAA